MAREKKNEVGTSFADLLKDVDLKPADQKPATPKKRAKNARTLRRPAEPPPPPPSSELVGDDRAAFMNAMGGVRRLEEKGPPAQSRPARPVAPGPDVSASDAVVRARLAALVGGGVRFNVERDGDRVRGWRVGTAERIARELEGQRATPGATLDLHGLRAAEAERQLVRFVRKQRERGVRRVCIVHGKGLHSEHGVGVLGDHTLDILTHGGAAPLVLAFATAAPNLGGSGALIVQLIR